MKKILPLFFIALSALSYLIYSRYVSQSRSDVTIMGKIDMSEGIGRLALELACNMKDNLEVDLAPTNKIKKDTLPNSAQKMLSKKHSHNGKVLFYQDLLWQSGVKKLKKIKLKKGEEQIRIAYSMFESTQIPEDWVNALNSLFDAVVVPDKFLVDVYKNSGVNIPIFIIPLAFDLHPFIRLPLKEKCNKPMVFANFGGCIERKNHPLLIRAFAKAFGNSPDVVLKINSPYKQTHMDTLLVSELEGLGSTNIQFTQLNLPQDAYLKQFQTVDCYVSISRGEGFSIQPREAMALGIPVIATNNTAQTTICESNLVYAISCPYRQKAHYLWGAYHGYNFDCDIDEVVSALRDVYENYDQYLKKGTDARQWAEQYQYENLKSLYAGILKPKKVLLGKENSVSPDELITDSKEFFEKYNRLKIIK